MIIWLSPRDVSHLAGIPLRTLQRWVADGHVAARRPSPRTTLVDFDGAVAYANRNDADG